MTHRRAASLGVPGTDRRAGVAPDGKLQIRPGDGAPHAGSHAQSLHVSLGLDASTRAMRSDAPVLEVGDATLLVDPADGALAVDLPREPVVHTATFDWLWRLPVALREEARGDVRTWRWPNGALAIESRPFEARVLVRLPLEPTRALPSPTAGAADRLVGRTNETLAGLVDFALPDPTWNRVARALLTQAALFVHADGHIPYALWPSVYDADVYGLEEDWLMHALACFGCTDVALRALRSSYLGASHLSKHHYLHDLRNGLTPWQTERLLRLAGRRAEDVLAPDEIERLRECARWLRTARAKTASATGAPDARGIRTFPGLLPPFRFGGDLDFPTQSLYTDAANAVGLESLARMVGGDEGTALFAEAAAYRTDILAAFDAVRVGDFQPLHTGGGDPGSYYQLMAAGILDPLDFFARGDARADSIDAFLETGERLLEGLPRFDDWGSAGYGIDAHYAVGYLLRALRTGRRAIFETGLRALVSLAMDPEVYTFREVDRVDRRPPQPWQDAHFPGRRLGQTEPCVGGVGVTLLCIRNAIVHEKIGVDGRPGPALSFLAGVPKEWWRNDGAELRLADAPTFGGRVSIRATRAGGVVHVVVDAPGAETIEIVPIDPAQSVVHLPPGRHHLALRAVAT